MKISRNIVVITRNLLILLGMAVFCLLLVMKVSDKYSLGELPKDYKFSHKKSWVGQYLSGYHAAQQHDYEKASEFFAKSVQLGNSTETTQVQTMNLLIVAGKFNDAFEIADHLYQNNQNVLASIVKIIKETERGNFKSADIIANQLSKQKEGTTVLNQVIYAWVKFGNGNYLAAKNIFDSMQKETRFLPFINYHYALVADLAGDKKRSHELYTKLAQIKNPPVGIAAATYNYFLKINDKKTADIVAKNYGTDRIIHLKEYHKVSDAKLGIAESLADTGTIIMTEYKDDSAATFFRLALFLEPDFEEIKLLLANILMSQGDHDAANKLLKSISETSPIQSLAKLAIARNYEAMKQDTQAKQYYEKLAESENTRLDALINLADLKREAENYDEAVKYYTQALDFGKAEAKKNGTDLDQNYWALYFARGVSYERLGKWDESEKDLKQALVLNPNQPDVLNYLGYSWIESGKNLQEGVKMVTHAYQLKPEDSHILDSVGWGWYKLGNFDNSLKFLEAAISQMPYDPTVNEHLGDLYWRLGRQTEAKYQWRRALENNPEKKYVEPLKEKLNNGLTAESAPVKVDTSAIENVDLKAAPLEGEPEEMEGK